MRRRPMKSTRSRSSAGASIGSTCHPARRPITSRRASRSTMTASCSQAPSTWQTTRPGPAASSSAEAFAANAFFTLGEVIFEVPTGVVADTRGRRFSYLLGAATLLVSTLLYLLMWGIHAPLLGWAVASMLLGLGFTFFSGATEAWLVDALAAAGFTGHLEQIFGRAQTVSGAAMLVGTVSGGLIAQWTSLGVPYVIRAAMLGVTVVVAIRFMHDLGFSPQRDVGPDAAVRAVIRGSIDGGFRNPP